MTIARPAKAIEHFIYTMVRTRGVNVREAANWIFFD